MLGQFVPIAAIVVAGLVSLLGTAALIPLLRRAAVLDRPNRRSSHVVPTPRGGGIAVTAAVLIAWLLLALGGFVRPGLWAVLLGTLLLALVSWVDDTKGLSPAPRLLSQFVATGLGLAVAMPAGLVFQGLFPAWLDLGATAVLWIWFVNLFNFMDGIDGIAGSEAAAIGVGLVLFASLGIGADGTLAAFAASLVIAALGFLVWNWSPARIFLGDVGSIPLGYLLGFLLLSVAARGHWRVALILPLYFLADATITLGRRALRGEKIWQAHREHFYQRATQRGLSHAEVVWRMIAADIVLILCGWGAENGYAATAIPVAVVTVAVLLAELGGAFRREPA